MKKIQDNRCFTRGNQFRNSKINNSEDAFKTSYDLNSNTNNCDFEYGLLQKANACCFNKVEKNERILKTYLNSDNVRRFTKRDFKNVKDKYMKIVKNIKLTNKMRNRIESLGASKSKKFKSFECTKNSPHKYRGEANEWNFDFSAVDAIELNCKFNNKTVENKTNLRNRKAFEINKC